mgnify:CR=1 FL=1
MKKSLAIAALALATTFTTSLTAAQAETLNVGMSGGYFPFTFVKLDKLQGFEVDFINAIAAETGDDVNFVTMSFSGLIGALESGRIDTVANQITVTPEREAKFAFSQPYVYDGAQVVVEHPGCSWLLRDGGSARCWRLLLDGHAIGAFICYESVFPNFVRRFAASGA